MKVFLLIPSKEPNPTLIVTLLSTIGTFDHANHGVWLPTGEQF